MISLLAALRWLFPARFRRQFETEIVEQVRTDYRRARARGALPAARFWLATAHDLLRSACAERWRPAWEPTPRLPIPAERNDMRTMLSNGFHDLAHAVRVLRDAPGLALTVVTTLGLAIGANVAIFSVLDTVLLEPLPYPEQDRLVHIAASAPGWDFPEEFGVSSEFYLQYSESPLLEDVALFNNFTATLRAVDRTERVWTAFATPSIFSTLRAAPILGRLPSPDDEEPTAILSHALWTSWFGSDPEIIGRTIHSVGADRTVIGVMGPDFWFPNDRVLLWVPFMVRPEGLIPGRFGAGMVGRMASGVDIPTLTDELGSLAARLPERFGGTANYAQLMERHRPIVRPWAEQLFGNISGPLWVLLGAVVLVLLIACGNVTNLLLVRAEHRQQDLAIRRALGAGLGALIRTQLAEALVLAALGGGLAVALGWAGVPVFIRFAPADVPRLAEAAVDPSALAFTLGITLLAGLACGLVPAIRAAAPNLTRLRDAGARGTTRGRHWARDGLVVGQTALALVLLIGSGLLLRSFQELRAVDPGYETEDRFTFQIAPEGEHLTDARAYARFHTDFMARLRALPGVESVGLVENVPLNEGVAGTRFYTADEPAATEQDGEAAAGAHLSYTWAAGDYFATMGIEVLRGRPFRDADHESDLGNVVVSRSAAEMLWPGEDPLGRQVRMRDAEAWETVVGVVEDVMQYGFRDNPEPLVYYSLVGQGEDPRQLGSPAYVLRTRRAEQIAPEVLALVREVAPGAPMYRVFTMARLAADSMIELSFTMLTLGTASLLALALGAIGLFGVLSYTVAERSREIGVRMALGAHATRVRRMVVGQGALLVGLGIVIGLAVAAASTRVLDALLFGVEASDPLTFGSMAAAMLAVGLLASYLPALRASCVDPVVSMRD